ncbi:hypothetical protein MMPV_005995 [Pyropia vietnamensis]
MASPPPWHVTERSRLLRQPSERPFQKVSREHFDALDECVDGPPGGRGANWGRRRSGGGDGRLTQSSTHRPFRRVPAMSKSSSHTSGMLTDGSDNSVGGGGGGWGGRSGGVGGDSDVGGAPSEAHRRRVERLAGRLGLSAKAREKLHARLTTPTPPAHPLPGSETVLDEEVGVDDVRSVRDDTAADDVDERVAALLSSLADEDESTARLLALSTAAVAAHIATAVVVYHILEGWSWTDCVYFTVVSLLTVGFGDLVPTKVSTKVFTCCFAFVSIALITAALSFIIGFIVDRQEEMVLGTMFSRGADADADGDTSSSFASLEVDAGRHTMVAAAEAQLVDHITAEEWYHLGISSVFYLVVLLTGTVVFSMLQGLSIVDSVYLVCMSATTIGFGDLDPSTPASRLFATVWLIFSTLGLAKVLADYTDTRLRAKQRRASSRLLSAHLTEHDFKILDEDGDGTVSQYEYTRMMLLKTGKCTQEDLDEIQRSFERLDRDGSGTIDRDEMLQAQVPRGS